MQVLVLLLSIVISLAQVDEEDIQRAHQQYADALKHDGMKRVVAADASNLDQILKKNRLVYILFWIDNNQATEKLNENELNTLEIVAQVFESQSVKFCTCEVMANQKFAVSAGVKYTGMVKIFNNGRPSTYSGQRSPDVIIPYIKKMMENPVTVISSRAEKKYYESQELPKIIAYFEKDSKDIQELIKTSLYFHPMILFFVVQDAKIAKQFHLKKINTVQFIKPLEKTMNFPAEEKITEKNLVAFLNKHKKQRLTKMMLENLHDIWAVDILGYMVSIFAIKNTEDGKLFLSMSKSLTKYFEKQDNLSFVWIDPKLFPTMLDYWRTTFQIDPLRPTIGVIDVRNQSSVWYKVQEDDEINLNGVKKWLLEVIAGNVTLEPMRPYEPPKPKTDVDEHSSNDLKEEL